MSSLLFFAAFKTSGKNDAKTVANQLVLFTANQKVRTMAILDVVVEM
jgi:hypothetical protein